MSNMKKTLQVAGQVLIVTILLGGLLTSSTHSQETEHVASEIEVYELDQGCTLTLEERIDLPPGASTELVEGIRNIIPAVQELLPADSVAVHVTTDSENILPVWGIGAGTVGDDDGVRIEIYFDPNHPNFEMANILPTLVHEMHHVGRIRNPDFELTLLECMVNEGLADHFAVEVLGCGVPPWASALTEEQIQENVDRVRPLLRVKHESWSTEFDEEYFRPWMFGRGGEDPIPHWTGYSIGWRVVEDYLDAHPDATASSLVWTHADTIASSTPELLVEDDGD
jgi:hypothetical protein